MITQRSEYKIADVTAVPSITGDIIPVRDGTGRLPVLKMEDIAFLVEAFCERGLAYSNPPYVDCPAVVFPPKVQTMRDIIGNGEPWTSSGVTRTLYGTGTGGYGRSYRLCYPVQEDATLPTMEENRWEAQSILRRFVALAPAAFYWKDQLPVGHEDFATHPVAASADLMRRMFYILKMTHRWMVQPVSADERWGGLSLSGVATYTETEFYEDGTVLVYNGSQSYSGKTQNDKVRVTATNDDYGHREHLADIYPRFGFTIHCVEPPAPMYDTTNFNYTTAYTKDAGITSARFKTRIAYSSLSVYLLVYIQAAGSCKRSSAAQYYDYYYAVRRVACAKVQDISGDADGWVQEWELYTPSAGLTPMELRSFATALGFSMPVNGTWGEITIETLTDLLIDGVPLWRTEIDSTGWDWEPPE